MLPAGFLLLLDVPKTAARAFVTAGLTLPTTWKVLAWLRCLRPFV